MQLRLWVGVSAALLLGGCAQEPSSSPSPLGSRSSSAATSFEPSSGAPTCTAGDLRVSEFGEGATGNASFVFYFTNVSNEPCSLAGRPTATLIGPDGQSSSLRTRTMQAFFETTPPPGWPVVTLAPGARAQANMWWALAWCGPTKGLSWRVEVPGIDGSFVVRHRSVTPRCDYPGEPAGTLSVGPIQPATS